LSLSSALDTLSQSNHTPKAESWSTELERFAELHHTELPKCMAIVLPNQKNLSGRLQELFFSMKFNQVQIYKVSLPCKYETTQPQKLKPPQLCPALQLQTFCTGQPCLKD